MIFLSNTFPYKRNLDYTNVLIILIYCRQTTTIEKTLPKIIPHRTD